MAYGGSAATMSMGYYNLSKYAPNNGLFALGNQWTVFDRFHVSSIPDSVAQHLYFVGGKVVPYDSTIPGQCPASVVALYNTTLFPQTFTNGSGTFMNSWTQQPPLNRNCTFIGELNSQNLCSGNPPFLPEIPNGVNNPQQIGDVFDMYNTSWAWYAEDFLAAELADCMQAGQRQFNVHDQPWQHYSTFALNNSAYWNLHQKDTNDCTNNTSHKQSSHAALRIAALTNTNPPISSRLSNCFSDLSLGPARRPDARAADVVRAQPSARLRLEQQQPGSWQQLCRCFPRQHHRQHALQGRQTRCDFIPGWVPTVCRTTWRLTKATLMARAVVCRLL